jgi:hypothetical protein
MILGLVAVVGTIISIVYKRVSYKTIGLTSHLSFTCFLST